MRALQKKEWFGFRVTCKVLAQREGKRYKEKVGKFKDLLPTSQLASPSRPASSSAQRPCHVSMAVTFLVQFSG